MDARPDLLAGGGGDLGDRLTAWAAQARVDEAVAARAREAFLRRTAADDATFAGVLLDLAERGGPVLAVGTGGRRHRGVVRAVGSDFVAIRTPEGREVLLAYRGIASVRPEAGAAAPTGDRVAALPFGLAEALSVVAEERPRVLAVTIASGDDGVAGELVAAGRDVMAVRLDGADRTIAHLAVANLAEVTLA